MKLSLLMNRDRISASRIVPVIIALMVLVSPLVPAVANGQTRTTQRPEMARRTSGIFDQGYGKGYDDGFGAGERDWDNSAPRDFLGSDAYLNRQQAFEQQYADLEQYRQGYELGFELGYNDGYFGRTRSAAVPRNAEILARAAALSDAQRARDRQAGTDQSRPRTTGAQDSGGPPPPPPSQTGVPASTEFKLRLQSTVDTSSARVGDKFTASVMNPSTFEGAIVEGHISKLNRSGRMTGKTELALHFDSISMNGQSAPFRADLLRIYESDKVKKIDEEGNVETGSRTSDTTKRSAIGAVAGAVLGGVAGGGKGAAIGAVIGGGAGAGTVLIEGNKDLRFEPGTEMLVRTEGLR